MRVVVDGELVDKNRTGVMGWCEGDLYRGSTNGEREARRYGGRIKWEDWGGDGFEGVGGRWWMMWVSMEGIRGGVGGVEKGGRRERERVRGRILKM